MDDRKGFNMKKFFTGLLGVMMSATLLPPQTVSAATYPDVSSSHWAIKYINAVSDYGYMSGKSTGLFGPEDTITIGEFAVVILNGFFSGNKTVKATDTHWADPYLNTLLNYGFLSSNGGANIVSYSTGWQDVALTREDAATILARLFECRGLNNGHDSVRNGYSDLSDSALSSTTAGRVVLNTTNQIQDIVDCIEMGVMTGFNGAFGIGQTMTRSEAAVVFNALTDKGFLTSKVNSNTTTTPSTPSVTVPSTPSTGTTTTPNTGSGTTTTTPSTSTNPNANVPAPSNVVLGSGQYNINTYTVPADTNKDGWLTYTEVEAVLTQLQKEYPQGTAWGDDKYYFASVGPNGGSTRAYGCAAFATMVSDRIFGDLPYRRVSADYSVDVKQIYRPGDLSHSTSINHWQVTMGEYWQGDGEYYYVADGNSNGIVNWCTAGSYMKSLETLSKYDGIVLYCYTRYPA